MIKLNNFTNGSLNVTVCPKFETKYKNHPLYEQCIKDCLLLIEQNILFEEWKPEIEHKVKNLVDIQYNKFLIEISNYEHIRFKNRKQSNHIDMEPTNFRFVELSSSVHL